MKRIPELDGIRGVAILLVLFWHCAIAPIQALPGTFWAYVQACGRLAWTGVDLFFVLSGFLIGGILLDSRGSPHYFRVFYLRRLLRILPLYALTLALTYVWSRSLHSDPTVGTGYWFACSFFVQNFWITAMRAFGAFPVTWSLAVEEQFYLTLPAIIRFLDRRWLPRLLALGIIGAPLVRVAATRIWPTHLLAAFTLMPCRADALLLGVAGAYAFRGPTHKWLDNNPYILRWATAILLAGAGGLTLRFHTVTDPLMISVGYTWMALLYLSVILLAVTQPQSYLGGAMRWSYLGFLGSIAYGVYLVHLQIATAIFKITRHSIDLKLHTAGDAGAMAIAVAITFGVCHLSFRYFEKPFIRVGPSYSRT